VELITTQPPPTKTTPVPCDNWSQWFNENSPQDEVIEWESKSDYELKQLGFCTSVSKIHIYYLVFLYFKMNSI
jgi:hypothetical protein